MRIYLLQYFCATSQLIYVVKSCVIEQRVTDCWKVSQVYHNVFSCCVLTREYRLNPCEPLPPSTLTPCPTKRLPVLLQRIVGFLLPKQLLLQLCAFSSMSFFCFVPMLFQLFASLHTRCSHCLLFALRISHQPCLPPSSLWTFFFPSCFSCIDFVQFDFSKVLTKNWEWTPRIYKFWISPQRQSRRRRKNQWRQWNRWGDASMKKKNS